MIIRKITAAEILAETELLARYAAECSIREIGKINPQPEMYRNMEQVGVNQCFGAFTGKMVGFASLLMCVLPHYGEKVATVESIYGEGGLELMAEIERFAREQGCKAILYSAPAGGRLETLLSLKKSYRCTNVVFCRQLTPKP